MWDRRIGTTLLAALLLWPAAARADFVMTTKAAKSSTIAEFFVEEGSIRVELEIGLGDAIAFRNLLPDELYDRLSERLGFDAIAAADRVPRFFREDLVLRSGDRPPIRGRVVSREVRPRVGRDVLSGEPLPPEEGTEHEPVIFVTLEYPLHGQPPQLTFRPPINPATGGVAAEIGFVVYHRGLPVINFRYLGTDETLDLDWEDPWYSRFRNRNLKRQYDAPMMTFLYVEPFEVRHETVLRPLDLQRWIDLGLDGEKILAVERQEEVKQAVVDFLMEHDQVTIDGVQVQPTLDRIHFIRRTLRRTGVIDPPEDLDLTSATLGIIFLYPTSGLPQEVTMDWDLFDERVQVVPATATDEAGGLPYTLRPDDHLVTWQNFLKNPRSTSLVTLEPPPPGRRWPVILLGVTCTLALIGLAARYRRAALRGEGLPRRAYALGALLVLGIAASVPLAGSSSVTQAESKEVISGLLRNVYRAFDYRDESQIYDILDRSATGDLLAQIYLETRRGLEVQNQGGAQVKVEEVELIEVETDDLPGEVAFRSRAVWNVSGSVGHWGHIHKRTNQYEALLTVKAVDGAWKITELELLQEERL